VAREHYRSKSVTLSTLRSRKKAHCKVSFFPADPYLPKILWYSASSKRKGVDIEIDNLNGKVYTTGNHIIAGIMLSDFLTR